MYTGWWHLYKSINSTFVIKDQPTGVLKRESTGSRLLASDSVLGREALTWMNGEEKEQTSTNNGSSSSSFVGYNSASSPLEEPSEPIKMTVEEQGGWQGVLEPP